MKSPAVIAWWLWLMAASAVNVALWLRLFFAARRGEVVDRRQLLLSAGFVFGCAFRSLLPRADVQRICLVDSPLSSVLVGRSVATVAELCLMTQVALTLRSLAQARQAPRVARLALVLVPLIAVAEIHSWYAVVTTNYLGNTCEESLWALCAALAAISLAVLLPKTAGATRRYTAIGLVFAAGYVVFMLTVDVPMYLTRYLADQRAGRAYLGPADGLRNLATRWVVTFSWGDWHEELAWMALYFSVAVWVSLSMVRAGRLWGQPEPASVAAREPRSPPAAASP
jgi:hypothetical protein